MAPRRERRARCKRSGFTLAEVAVTLVIMGIALLWILDGLTRAKFIAAHTHNQKMANELGLMTLGEIEAGLFWEEIDDQFSGNYAEEGYEAFTWEVVLGDESFLNYEDPEGTLPFDKLAADREKEEEEEEDDYDEDDEEAEEPYEQVRIRVLFPQLTEAPAELILERWVPWEQVYGSDDEDEESAEGIQE